MKYHPNDEVPDEESKTTSEKPVSLSPLSLKEALEGLLKIAPEADEEKQTEKTEDKN